MRTRRLATIAVSALACMSPAAAAALPAPTIDSPDGTQVAFVQVVDPTAPNPAYAVWTARSDGTSAHQLTHPPLGSSDSGPNWSPDGGSIAFTRSSPLPPPSQPDLAVVTVAVATGVETRLTAPGQDGAQPAWSPDGTQIAFVSGRDHDGRSESEDETRPNGEVYVMRADGSRPRRITHTRGPETFVSWSASGTRLVFAAAPASTVFAPFRIVLTRSDGGCPTAIAPGQALPAGVDLDALALRCDPPDPVRPRLVALAPATAAARVHAGDPVEASVARGLLAGLGDDTAIRSLTIGRPPAGTHVRAGARWLRLRVTGSGARNDAAAVRPAWEATLLADAYAHATAHGLHPLAGLTIVSLASGRVASTTQAAAHDPVGDRFPNETLAASTILRSLRAATLPRGARLASIRFARVAGAAVPEIVVRVSGASAVGRLFEIRDRLLGPLQLDQGAYLELRSPCGSLLGAVVTGGLGTRPRVGVASAAACP